MKKVTIYKGFHRPLTLIPACFKNMSRSNRKQVITKKITFTDSCRYRLDNGDQEDWNKLFGICYGLFGIHKNSARFVWRYNEEYDTIDIGVYYYIDGIRKWNKVKEVRIGETYTFEIWRDLDNVVRFHIDGLRVDEVTMGATCPKQIFGCGLYFGGNRRAPQDITILK